MNLSRRKLLGLVAGAFGVGAAASACRPSPVSNGARSPDLAPSVSAPRNPSPLPATTTPTEPGAPSTAVGRLIEVIGREGWTPLAQGTFRRHTIERITIHHTAVELTDNRDAPSRLRRHTDWHMSQGWPDLAYHFVVDRNGNIYEGRPVDAVGDTFTDYDPTGHLLPCFEGDFNRQSPSAEQIAAMTQIVAWAMQTFSVPRERIAGHRDWATTTCPGEDMYWRIPGIGRDAADHGATGLAYLRGDDAAAAVDRIQSGAS